MYRNIVRVSKSEEALVEIFLEHQKEKFEIDQPLKPIPDVYVPNYIFFIRATFIHNMHTYNNKFNMEQAINLYQNDNSIKKVQLFDKRQKLNLSKVHLIGGFMGYKIKQWSTTQQASPSEVKNRKDSINPETLTPWTNYGLKLNCNFQIQMRIDDNRLFINKFLIYRTELSLNPIQMVAFVYFETKKYFTAYIYDTDLSWTLKKKIKMAEVEAFIPYAKNMLKLGLYESLGSKIFKAFKNSLMIYSYVHNRGIDIQQEDQK